MSVSTSVAGAAGTAIPAGLQEVGGGTDTLYLDNFGGTSANTVKFGNDATSPFIYGETGYLDTVTPLNPVGGVRYNWPVSVLNPTPNTIETVNVTTSDAQADTVSVQYTSLGSTYYLDTGTSTIADDTVNISSDATTKGR